jgi:hypothetical protein
MLLIFLLLIRIFKYPKKHLKVQTKALGARKIILKKKRRKSRGDPLIPEQVNG